MGLYLDVFLMRDRQTGTVWAHLDGQASQGPLAGERLPYVPMPQMTWAAWLEAHPDTVVLDPDTPFADRYRPVRIGQPGRGEDLYGDDRLPANTLVVGVENGGAFAGFPIDALASQGGLANVEVGGEPTLVLYDPVTRTGIAFSRVLDGVTLTFSATPDGEGLVITDDTTGSTWDVEGRAVAGPLAGARLTFVPSFLSEWYGWSAYHPKTDLYGSEGGPGGALSGDSA